MERLNAEALAALVGDHDVKLAGFPADLVAAARIQARDVLGEFSQRNATAAKVHASYNAFRERSAPRSRVSIEAVLRARGLPRARAAPPTKSPRIAGLFMVNRPLMICRLW
jgi:TRAP-type mannitol/chloroaromatic compound transport system substrate-binding protein